MDLNYDDIKDDEKYKEIIKNVENEVREIMAERNIKGLGSIHVFEGMKKKILKERYGIDYKTVAERNPNMCID